MGLKIRGFGFDWRALDADLLANGHQEIGENPLIGFSFPLDFTFVVNEKEFPVGFSFNFTTGGAFSRRPNTNNYSRIRADITSFGVYKGVTFGRCFVRVYLLYSRNNIRLLTYNETSSAALFRFTGGELNALAETADGIFQFGLLTRNRLQFGLEVGYHYIFRFSGWTLVPNIRADLSEITSSERNLSFGPFLYVRIY
jgi:hypothetical protein